MFTVDCWFSPWVCLAIAFKNFAPGLADWFGGGLDSWCNVPSWVGVIGCGGLCLVVCVWVVYGFAGVLLLGCCGKRFGVWRWFAFERWFGWWAVVVVGWG